MSTGQKSRARRPLRAAALVPALVILISAAPAMAEPPDSKFWLGPPFNNSPLWYILVLGGIPLLLFVAIWFIVSVPSIIRSQKYDAAVAFRDDPEWFGGPREGIEKAPKTPASGEERGGADADW